ncbi:MAG: hypothetical protein ABIL76_07375, partial [candidate division WOR-3 bacterium]
NLIVKANEKFSENKILIKGKKVIYISNKNEKIDMKVYKINGGLVYESKIDVKPGFNEIFNLNKRGAYILKINNEVYKIGG